MATDRTEGLFRGGAALEEHLLEGEAAGEVDVWQLGLVGFYYVVGLWLKLSLKRLRLLGVKLDGWLMAETFDGLKSGL